jgi:hypothetical protein
MGDIDGVPRRDAPDTSKPLKDSTIFCTSRSFASSIFNSVFAVFLIKENEYLGRVAA